MTDLDLLEKKLAFVESCVSELRRLAVADRVTRDVLENHLGDLLAFTADCEGNEAERCCCCYYCRRRTLVVERGATRVVVADAGRRPLCGIDLVLIEQQGPVFQHRVLEEGRLVYDGDLVELARVLASPLKP